MLASALLFGLVSWAALTDLARHKIYNWTTYPGILAALGLAAARSLVSATALLKLDTWDRLMGGQSLPESLLGFFVCGVLMLLCFVMFQTGAGDVKLMAMLGAFLGWQKGIEALLWTFVLGGGAGLVLLIWRVGAWRLLGWIGRQILATLRLGRWSPLDDQQRAALQPPLYLAPSALAAVIIVRFNLLEYWR